MRSMRRWIGRVQISPRLTARNQPDGPADGGQERHVDQQTAIADQPETEDVESAVAGDLTEPSHEPNHAANEAENQRQLEHRPGDDRQKSPPHGKAGFILVGQLGEDSVEVPGLFADADQFAKDGGKEIARIGQGVGQRLAVVHRVADRQQVLAQRAGGSLGFAGPGRSGVDAGLQRRAHATA